MNLSLVAHLLTLWLASGQSNPTPGAPNPVYMQLSSPQISQEAITITGLSLQRDAATFVFNSGEFYPFAPVNGKVFGAVFIGDGEFRLTPPIESEKHYLQVVTKESSLTERFTELVLHFTDSTWNQIANGMTATRGPAGNRARSILEDRLTLLREGRAFSSGNIAQDLLRYDIAARILADVYDTRSAGFFNAFIKGRRFEHLMFRVDPKGVQMLAPEEVVLASFNDDDLGIWNSFHMEAHYTAGNVADEDHRAMDIRHQQIEATIRGTRLNASVRTTIEVRVDGLRTLTFDLAPTLRVGKVTDGQTSIEFIQGAPEGGSDLTVIFPEPLTRGLRELSFEYGGDQVLQQMGSGNFALDAGARANWYPASIFGDRATYDMTFRIPKDLVMVASGHPQSETSDGNEVITRWKSDIPIAVAGFNFGRFRKSALNDEKIPYVIESYANTKVTDLFREVELADLDIPVNFDTTRLMDKARDEAQVALGIYQKYFGALPYGRLAMTQQPYLNFGQAWPMLVYMPLTAYLDSTTRNSLGLGGATNFFRIVGPHEVAHQWWGHILGWKSYRDQWMSEGFSEFSASLFAHLVYGDRQFLDFWKEQRSRILGKNEMGQRPGDVASVTMGYRADNGRTGNVTQNVIYPKGAFILHMLRMMMYDNRSNDERFIAMMRDFVTTHHNQNVSTEDFKRIVEKHMTADMDITGTNSMDWFFDQFVYGTEIPRYRMTYQLEPSGQQTILKLRVSQSEVSDNFRMAVPVYLETEDQKLAKLGAVRLLGNSSQEATVTLPFRPRRVILAAYEDVLANIE